MSRAAREPDKVRGDQADEQHHATHRHRRPRGKCATGQREQLQLLDRDAQMSRFGLAERQSVVGTRA